MMKEEERRVSDQPESQKQASGAGNVSMTPKPSRRWVIT
jgi:hypothetical protein